MPCPAHLGFTSGQIKIYKAQGVFLERTFVRLVHKLKELIYHGLQEFPMRLQESWVLSNNIHDVRCHDSFVVLSSLDFAQAKQILDHSDQEAFFRFFVCKGCQQYFTWFRESSRTHCSRDRPNGPAKGIQVIP
jgi:hypothetical protein